MSNDFYSIGMLHVLSCSGLDIETTEKVANLGTQAGKLVDKGVDFVKSMDPRRIHGDWKKSKIHTERALDNRATGNTRAADRATERSDVLRSQAGKGAKRLGGTALGVGGLAYGMGDANTMENRAVRASNRMLGTDFSTKSRFGNLVS
jgi:hypothetical protein